MHTGFRLYQDHPSLSHSYPHNCPVSSGKPLLQVSAQKSPPWLLAGSHMQTACVCVCVCFGGPSLLSELPSEISPFLLTQALPLRLEGSGCVSSVFGRPGTAQNLSQASAQQSLLLVSDS